MYIVDRTTRFVHGFIASYGPTKIKQLLWDREFHNGKWDFIDNTVGDCVYPYLEKYSQRGAILDLGCGPGNTANEMAETSYKAYLGVDISEEALGKAIKRSKTTDRTDKNQFVVADFLSYQPTGQFDVILFRESLYHVPIERIRRLLNSYSQYLTDRGVFIVRLYVAENGKAKLRPTKMIEILEHNFEVVEKHQHGDSAVTVIVFRPALKK